jgi:phage/plasmid-associated DNA primase
LDVDPWVLNYLNDTLDLHTDKLRPHRREDLLSELAPVAYDGAALCPRWRSYLDRIMPVGIDSPIAHAGWCQGLYDNQGHGDKT